MTQFTVPWKPKAQPTDYGFVGLAIGGGVALLALAAVGYWVSGAFLGGHPAAVLLLTIGPALTGLGAFGAAAAVRMWPVLSVLLLRVALLIFLSVLFGTPFLVWGVNILFSWISVDLVASPANNPAIFSWFGGALTLAEFGDAIPFLPAWACLLLWPLQYPIVRDLINVGALIGLFNLVPAYFIWWERKVAGRIQSRLGPMRVGGWHGWAQSAADGIKLVLKEDLIPTAADAPLFRAAPYFAIIPSAMAFMVLPFGATYVFRDLDVSLVFILGILGVEVVAVILAGWASNNKWSVYGAMREVCQMISYEIPMGMALLVPVVMVGSLSLVEIGSAQSGGWFNWLAFRNPFAFVAFVVYFIASLASCKRAPFDLPEAESELVAGFHTEYSGFRWSLFFFAEYAAMFIVAALASILFLGAWHSPLPVSWGDSLGNSIPAQGLKGILFAGPVWLVAKSTFFVYVQIWLRWTLPRLRIDQVLYACVQVLLPLTMLLLLGATIWTWASTSDNATWHILDGIANVLLGLVGMVFTLGFPAIAMYGFYHRRRLVGNLAVDVLPGS